MEWVETTGRTVEEAKEAALDQLGVDEQDAEFEIVEEPRFGLFGRLRSEARVRARVRPTKPRPKEERRDRRGRRRSPGTDAATTPAGAGSGSEDGPPASQRAPRRTPERAASVPTAEASGSRPVTPDSASDDDGATADPSRRRPRPESGRATGPADGGDVVGGSDEAAAPRTRARRTSNSDRNYEDTSPGGGMDVSLDEQGVVARDFLDGLVERMGLEAEVVVDRPDEEIVELNLQGPDLGLLIGPKGATLLAIQDLTRTVVQRKTSAANGRIMVDVSGYRRKRKDALARFTQQVAGEVLATGTRRVLEPMSAADRKVVHDTVNDIEGVMTISEGEDPRRRVVILPVPTDA